MRSFLLLSRCLACLLVGHAGLLAEDLVTISKHDQSGTYEVTGLVVDYKGELLILKHTSGREESFAGERVVDIRTEQVAAHNTGDENFAAAEFEPAIEAYRAAWKQESRPWVRRQLLARLAWCYQHHGQPVNAAKAFLALYQDDPATRMFHCIPLDWTSSQPAAVVQQQARQWIQRGQPTPARLIAAGWVLATSQRAEARQVLRELASDPDSRIAFLAQAQSWRVETKPTPERIESWVERVGRMPESIRGGPYFVIGKAWSAAGQPVEAATSWMRTAILHAEQRELAARSLLAAGRELEKMKKAHLAKRLYQEIIADFAETSLVEEARAKVAQPVPASN